MAIVHHVLEGVLVAPVVHLVTIHVVLDVLDAPVGVQVVLTVLHAIIRVVRDALDALEDVSHHAMLVQDVVMDVNLDVIILAQVAVLLHAMQLAVVNYSVL